MTDSDPTDPENLEREPKWDEKVLRLNEGLQSHQLSTPLVGLLPSIITENPGRPWI